MIPSTWPPIGGSGCASSRAYLNLLLPFGSDSFPDLHQQGGADEAEQPSAVWIERWTGGIFRDSMLLLLEASTQAIALDLPCLDRELLAVTWRRLQTRQVTNFFQGSEAWED